VAGAEGRRGQAGSVGEEKSSIARWLGRHPPRSNPNSASERWPHAGLSRGRWWWFRVAQGIALQRRITARRRLENDMQLTIGSCGGSAHLGLAVPRRHDDVRGASSGSVIPIPARTKFEVSRDQSTLADTVYARNICGSSCCCCCWPLLLLLPLLLRLYDPLNAPLMAFLASG
jgi:hypothetical protein